MNMLSSKWFSLVCAGVNVVFAIQSIVAGSWFIFGLCSVFAAFCFNNFLKAE